MSPTQGYYTCLGPAAPPTVEQNALETILELGSTDAEPLLMSLIEDEDAAPEGRVLAFEGLLEDPTAHVAVLRRSFLAMLQLDTDQQSKKTRMLKILRGGPMWNASCGDYLRLQEKVEELPVDSLLSGAEARPDGTTKALHEQGVDTLRDLTEVDLDTLLAYMGVGAGATHGWDRSALEQLRAGAATFIASMQHAKA
jgi:hypothetical protein